MIAGVTSQIREKSTEVRGEKRKQNKIEKKFWGSFFDYLFNSLIKKRKKMVGWKRDGGLLSDSLHTLVFFFYFSLSHPTSIILLSFCSELEEMADGTVARAIHCGSVSSGFIFALVCRGRSRTGCLRL